MTVLDARSQPAPTPVTPAVAGGRMEWVDVCRGLTIIGVVLHHVTGAGLRHVPPGGTVYFALLTVNRLTQLVVPTFLFLSALVFARSPQERFSWRRYLGSRARQLLWPYLVWTALYLGFRIVTGAAPEPDEWLSTYLNSGLLHGKGYFHLYYLLVALQVVLLLPLIRPLSRWRLAWVLAGAAAVQLGIYLLNRQFWHLNSVGSLALWYVLPLAAGLALGAWQGRFEQLWERRRGWVLAACALALALYLPLGFAEVLGTPLNALAYSAGNWAYTLLAALVLSGLSLEWQRLGGRVSDALARLGRLSLQIYLLHPMLLWALDWVPYPGAAWAQPLMVGLYAVLAVGLPLALARLIEGHRLSVWLFGR